MNEKIKWHTEKRKIDDLIPYPKNPRKLTPEQKKQLKESLSRFDLVEIPAINTDNTIIAGHQRIKILQELGKGESEIDVRVPRENKLHPTMKPVEVVENAILNSSNRENIVADIFLGSGSTLIACEKTGRICYGMEIDPIYVDVIVQRWEDYTGKKAFKIE